MDLQREFNELSDEAQGVISATVDALQRDGNVDRFGQAMTRILEVFHPRAYVLGRRQAGEEDPPEPAAPEMKVIERELEYLALFIAAIQAGKYLLDSGALDLAAIYRRALTYLGRLRGTATEGYGEASEDALGSEVQWNWRMGGPEETHCSDCPELEAGNPYTWSELPTVPGANETECLFNCLCYLEREDGEVSFMRGGEHRKTQAEGASR